MRCFLSCAFCVSLSFTSVCVYIPSSQINLTEDKVKACDAQHPVVLSYLAWGQWEAKAWSPNPKSNCTQSKKKAYNFRCMFKKKWWKYCNLKLKEKIKYNYCCKTFFSVYLKRKKKSCILTVYLFPCISPFQQLSNMEYFKSMQEYLNHLQL